MAKRLNKTLLDYLVIGISPALIICLVDSLVLFLVQVFYRGNYDGRLDFCLTMFVIGAVLIGRISIEEGRERAILFAVPLGIAILLAIGRFVKFQGLLGTFSFPINCGLIALIWWASDRLVWDCTLIDEKEEDSGEGLLETIGLDRPDHAAVQREIAPRPDPAEATTSRDQVAASWWDRFVERRRRPHAPGVWVVYFSLAALPLFGIGQLFIPNSDMAARQFAFQLLFVYTASGLGLLLSTSFLGLRRYLRQRRQEMPLMMVNLWLGIGAALIFGVMIGALVLPRPNSELAISEPPIHIGSPDQESSRFGSGSEGVEEKQPDAQLEGRDDAPEDAPQSDQPGKNPTADGKKTAENGKKSSSSKDGEKSSNQGKDQGKEQGKEQGKDDSGKNREKPKDGKGKTDEKGDGKPGKDQGKSADKKQPEEKADEKNKSAGGSGTAPVKPPEEKKAKPQEGRKSSSTPRAPKLPHSSFSFGSFFAALFKWIFYIVLAVLLAYAAWKHRVAVMAALRDFWQALLDLWNRLFGKKDKPAKEAEEEAARKGPRFRHFADFTDPFVSGTAGRYSPKELVQYTFEALEAWARDNGQPRLPEQTPHEFARSVGGVLSSMADDARHLAELYCHAAYAPGTLSAASVTRLSHLWQEMRAARVVAAQAE